MLNELVARIEDALDDDTDYDEPVEPDYPMCPHGCGNEWHGKAHIGCVGSHVVSLKKRTRRAPASMGMIAPDFSSFRDYARNVTDVMVNAAAAFRYMATTYANSFRDVRWETFRGRDDS